MKIETFFSGLLVIYALSVITNGEELMGCNFITHLSGTRKKGEDQIELLKGKRWIILHKFVGGNTWHPDKNNTLTWVTLYNAIALEV